MAFNTAMMGVGGRVFILAITSEDLSINYNIDAELVSLYGVSAAAFDRVILNISGVDLVASSSTGYAIDGDSLNDLATLSISTEASTRILAKGGDGGNGGAFSLNGFAGDLGGTAIRYGCNTDIIGTGEVAAGGGGGGGGAGENNGGIPERYGGGGGGGSASEGSAGNGGSGAGGNGTAGSAGSRTTGGSGGTGAVTAGNGGAGGALNVNGTVGGSSATSSGGAGGGKGNAVNTQGFVSSIAGGVTITGAVI